VFYELLIYPVKWVSNNLFFFSSQLYKYQWYYTMCTCTCNCSLCKLYLKQPQYLQLTLLATPVPTYTRTSVTLGLYLQHMHLKHEFVPKLAIWICLDECLIWHRSCCSIKLRSYCDHRVFFNFSLDAQACIVLVMPCFMFGSFLFT